MVFLTWYQCLDYSEYRVSERSISLCISETGVSIKTLSTGVTSFQCNITQITACEIGLYFFITNKRCKFPLTLKVLRMDICVWLWTVASCFFWLCFRLVLMVFRVWEYYKILNIVLSGVLRQLALHGSYGVWSTLQLGIWWLWTTGAWWKNGTTGLSLA